MEKKFTQGNWSVDYDNENEPSIIRTDKRAHPKDAIAIVFSKSSGIEEAEYNAKLIAAAPDLFNALMLLVERNERNWHINLAWTFDTKEKIMAALKKATE